MKQEDALKILAGAGAVLTAGHFVYTSGKHGSAYVNKDAVYRYPIRTDILGKAIAEVFATSGVEVVVAPEKGAIKLGDRVAYHLSKMSMAAGGSEVVSVYLEKETVSLNDGTSVWFRETGDFVAKREYEKEIPCKRVLIVEDILNTGLTGIRTVNCVERLGGAVVGFGALCNRGDITAEKLGISKLFCLTNVQMDAFDEAGCPLCAQKIPVNTNVGKGKQFLARKAAAE